MNETFLTFLLPNLVSGFIIGSLIVLVLRYRKREKNALENRKKDLEKGVLADLELATSDQLLHELRMRPGLPYLLLKPIENEDHKGITIEIHDILPIPCLMMLQVATSLTYQQLKKSGIEIPEPLDPESGGDWKEADPD